MGTLIFKRRSRYFEASECGNYTVCKALVGDRPKYSAWFRPRTLLGTYDAPEPARARCEAHDAEHPDKHKVRLAETMQQYKALYGRGDPNE